MTKVQESICGISGLGMIAMQSQGWRQGLDREDSQRLMTRDSLRSS